MSFEMKHKFVIKKEMDFKKYDHLTFETKISDLNLITLKNHEDLSQKVGNLILLCPNLDHIVCCKNALIPVHHA